LAEVLFVAKKIRNHFQNVFTQTQLGKVKKSFSWRHLKLQTNFNLSFKHLTCHVENELINELSIKILLEYVHLLKQHNKHFKKCFYIYQNQKRILKESAVSVKKVLTQQIHQIFFDFFVESKISKAGIFSEPNLIFLFVHNKLICKILHPSVNVHKLFLKKSIFQMTCLSCWRWTWWRPPPE